MSSLSVLDPFVKHASSQDGWFVAALKFSNLHILLVASGLIAGTASLTGHPVNFAVLIAGCCGVFLIYQIDRSWLFQSEDEFNQPQRVSWVRRNRNYILISTAAGVALGCIAASFLDFGTLLVGGLLAVLGLVYLMPIMPGGIRPKSIWYVKPLAISLAWAFGGVVLPLVAAGMPLRGAPMGLLLYRVSFILPNVLLTDWQDRHGDEVAGLKSLAMMLTEKQLRVAAATCIAITLLIGLLLGSTSQWPAHYYVDLIGPIILLAMCCRPLSDASTLYGWLLDIVIAWPMVTAFVVWNL